jgi:hypothetical protein
MVPVGFSSSFLESVIIFTLYLLFYQGALFRKVEVSSVFSAG